MDFYDDNLTAPTPPWVWPGNGVTMGDGLITASYNALNQPVAIYSPALPAGNFLWLGFDPLGRCVKRWLASASGGAATTNPATYFYYDEWNMIQEGVNGNAPGRVYVHGARVDEIVASCVWSGNQWAYHHYDARGHCILLTLPSGNIQEKYEYDAFGQPYFYNASGTPLPKVNNRPVSAWGNRFLFTGREWLGEIGLYDYRNRMYQPELGRFMQPDPKQFAAGDYNLYRYCHNDPVNKTDPFGLEFTDAPFELVPFVTIPGGEKYGGVQFGLSPNVVTQPVAGGYTARVEGLNVTVQKAQVATKVQVKGEARARNRTESQIKASTEHEQGHKDVARSFDKDNQQREFPKVHPSADKAKGGAADQLQKDFEKAQKEHHDRIKDLMKKESFR